MGRLQSRYGFVFDHATPIGEIVLASPTYHRIEAEFRGRAAHAGVRPETGRSAIQAASRAIAAMRLGRLDAETTANVGTIAGGTATNVVPERCRIEAEVRAVDDKRAELVVTELVDHLQDAANAGECDLDVNGRADVPRLPGRAARSRGGDRRARAARDRLRAAADRHGRRLGRERSSQQRLRVP